MKEWWKRNKELLGIIYTTAVSCILVFVLLGTIALVAMTCDLVNVVETQRAELEELRLQVSGLQRELHACSIANESLYMECVNNGNQEQINN